MLITLSMAFIISVAASFLIVFWGYQRRLSEKLRQQVDEKREEIVQAVFSFRSLIMSESYISKAEYGKWSVNWVHLRPLVNQCIKRKVKTDLHEELEELHSAFEHGDSLVKRRNEEYIQLELEKNRDFFDNIEDYLLTDDQRRAIVTDEKHTLVIAGAGAGKTSTIVGKAGYILRKGLARPNEILIIIYARKARDEVYERVLNALGQRLRVETFHSLGSSIIASVEKTKPSVSQLSTDRLKFHNAIMGFFQKKCRNPECLEKINRYFAFHRTPYRSEFSFTTRLEYDEFLRNNQIRSLQGELVKSLEECEIANFLYVNGIDYVYEDNYKVETASESRRQYKPDFFLPKYGIYIEHFGIDKNGKTAPFIDREIYLAEMSWKRRTHRESGTTLVETYSWERSEGILLQNLKEKLTSAGIEFSRIPPEQIFDKLNRMGLVHPFAKLTATFLNLFKSSCKKTQDLLEQSKGTPDYSRQKAFLDIFEEIYNDYEESLGEEIDFNDMINRAEEYLTRGLYCPKLKYILVDEFQDISHGRFRLLKTLLDQNSFTKLFCVGDDWQSIYRFTGSDVSFMIDFDRHFYPSERLDLGKTFRLDSKLCDFSSKFILQNPNQIKKQLTSDVEVAAPSVTLLWSESGEDKISEALKRIEASGEKHVTVFIIGRYNYQRPTNLSQLRKRHRKLSINYMTAHSSKGKEADYVIVIGLTARGYAFPSQIEDDPLLDLVLTRKEPIPNAEERRLFYVSMTRAKKHVYLIADAKNPSSFVREIESGDYEVILEEYRNLTGKSDTPFMNWVRTQESSR